MLLKIHMISSLIISIFMTLIMFSMKQKFKSNFNSTLNVECGFKSMAEKNFKFSNQFFMISILFVIFDMELIAIIPLPLIHMNFMMISIFMLIFMLLATSILLEWHNGLIEWIKYTI